MTGLSRSWMTTMGEPDRSSKRSIRSAKLVRTPPSCGGAEARTVTVAAKPTMGGISGNHAFIRAFMYPVSRGRTSNSSTRLQMVGVSNVRSFSRTAWEMCGILILFTHSNRHFGQSPGSVVPRFSVANYRPLPIVPCSSRIARSGCPGLGCGDPSRAGWMNNTLRRG
jgi:hypothetical protein